MSAAPLPAAGPSANAAPAHRLDPLLAPRSIAVIGASIKPDTPGNTAIRMAVGAGWAGRLYPINPNYGEIEGLACHASLDVLPEVVDLVVLSVANARLEGSVASAIRAGARALTIFASGLMPDDPAPALPERVAAMCREAGIPVCGGNCMGFYNLDQRLRVAAFHSPLDMEPGGIAWIAQSGSVFGALAHNDRRLGFNLCVSAGGEWVTTAADYLDWVLNQPTTRAVGLFLESVRDPGGFVATLDKARRLDIPVVCLKVGRTPASAAMALSHTGALAGSDAAYRALFDRLNVLEVGTPDELAATLQLLGHDRRPAVGGLAAMHDSGGERELAVDLNARIGVPYAAISEATRATLAHHLDYGLEAMNPLDAWGTGQDAVGQFAAMMGALLDDPDTAMGLLFVDLRDGYHLSETYLAAVRRAAALTDKPVAIATNYALVRNEGIARRAAEAGIPVIDGTEEALLAVRHALAFRDRARLLAPAPCPIPTHAREAARRRAAAGPVGDADALAMLSDYGIPVPRWTVVATEGEARAAAEAIGYPAVLKTAEGVAHKTEVGGVKLGLRDEDQVAAAYRDLAGRLGPSVLVQAMSGAGVEMSLGTIHDPDFGPYLMIAAGGILVELLDDNAVALAPVGPGEAAAKIARLRSARLLAGVRGAPAADAAALADIASRLSWLAHDLRDHVAEIEMNPVIARPEGCMAVDALFVMRGRAGAHR